MSDNTVTDRMAHSRELRTFWLLQAVILEGCSDIANRLKNEAITIDPEPLRGQLHHLALLAKNLHEKAREVCQDDIILPHAVLEGVLQSVFQLLKSAKEEIDESCQKEYLDSIRDGTFSDQSLHPLRHEIQFVNVLLKNMCLTKEQELGMEPGPLRFKVSAMNEWQVIVESASTTDLYEYLTQSFI
ncbi:hypothetical protein N7495_004537 [Penicillium taxi]|uniref:uncharacterized protein n=1 Tax=Penicillium taxi TaxID=168475 RepID=UPI00254563E1|nr:uncharacterized protein N7495_004537 [Penicillium taxi]KAJ5899793.1 hypothetical protein N7495_004537 [Penicillium taxi]